MTAAAPFTLLVKPAGADCNLNCGYCFYLKKAGLYPDDRAPRMTQATAEAMIRAFFSVPQRVYTFAWQGGEPTLMGPDFFQEVFAMQKRLAPAGTDVVNALQTNGTLLTPEWATLLREHRVLVGVSIDGPAELHNAQRRWADRNGAAVDGPSGDTHRRVEDAIALLREEKVAFNALTVVGRHNQDYPVEIYDYIRSLKIRHMQFIPLVEWRDASAITSFSVTPEGWGSFLNAIFDRWFPREVRRVSIRHHDTIMELLVRGNYNVCTISGACGGHFVVEHTGDIYPCDFFVESELLLGNVTIDRGENPFVLALRDPRHAQFRQRKAHWNARCSSCEYLWLCSGDCPKMRPLPAGANGGGGRGREHLSALCEGWRAFYDHTLPHFERLARSVAPEVTGAPPVFPQAIQSWDSGAPCFCGSGKSAGACHLTGPSS